MALGLLAVLLLVLVAVGWQPLLTLDSRVAVGLHGHALDHPLWVRVNLILSDRVWDPWTMRALLAVAVVLLLRRREGPLALWLAATAALGAALQQGLKHLVGRDRPRWERPVDSADFAAMPSGHAMTAALTCVLLLWLTRVGGAGTGGWWRAASAVGAVSVAGVAFTRLALGVHWLTDTLVGSLLGTALALGSLAVWNAWGADRTWRSPRTDGRIPL